MDYTVFPRDGFVLPRTIKAHAELAEGTVVDIDIAIAAGRARAVKVTVTAERGVGWTMLANVPTRDIVGTAVLDKLMRAEMQPGGALQLAPLRKSDANVVRQIVQGMVGYNPKTKTLKRVPA